MILTEKIFDNIAMIYWFTSDVLAGVLGEGDILSVDDGAPGPVVPTPEVLLPSMLYTLDPQLIIPFICKSVVILH